MMISDFTSDELKKLLLNKKEWSYHIPLYKSQNEYIFSGFQHFSTSHLDVGYNFIVVHDGYYISGVLGYRFSGDRHCGFRCNIEYVDIHEDHEGIDLDEEIIRHFMNSCHESIIFNITLPLESCKNIVYYIKLYSQGRKVLCFGEEV